MSNHRQRTTRVLAIDPNTAGFGYVIFEGPERLIDWGLPHVAGNKHRGCLKRIAQLLCSYEPDLIVLEDIAAPGCRRRARVRRLIRSIEALVKEHKIRVAHVDRSMLGRVFADLGCRNKDDVAAAIVRRHPALAHRLPPRRKCWMSEDVRMSLFDAAALYATHLAAVQRFKRAA